MHRHGDLYAEALSFSNLLNAARQAQRGKRQRPDVLAFHYDLEPNLLRLRDELRCGEYRPGRYRLFRITDPKPRLISAAPYRDRVLHHALCHVIEPLFERRFIFDSYANRRDKGTHRAVDRCNAFARRYRYVLKCDIKSYFPSIDHQILRASIARVIKCPQTLALIDLLIASAPPETSDPVYFGGDTLFTPWERRCGLPIGNLTSQLFGNVYLNGFDHWVKEELRAKAYLRFVDDFLLFSDDLDWLGEALRLSARELGGLRLRLHARKCQRLPVRCGVEFLGWQVYPDHRRLRRATGVRFQRKLRAYAADYAAGKLDLRDVNASVQSWLGHLSHGDTWGLRQSILSAATFQRRPHSRGGSK